MLGIAKRPENFNYKKVLSVWLYISMTAITGVILWVTTPFTWFIVMPLRGIKTLISGWEPVEEGYHLKRIINEAYEGVNNEDKYTIINMLTAS